MSLGAHVRLGVRARGSGRGPEVAHGLTRVAAALDQHGLAASGRAKRQLVEGQDFT